LTAGERAPAAPTPPFVAWAPGRVNLIGEHTDYSGGLVLPVAIQLGVEVEVRTRASEISLSSEFAGPTGPIAADGAGPPATTWARYAQAVAFELAALGRPALGLDAVVRSNLPVGIGLSSSAALEVAIGLALCAVAGFELEPLELALACQRAELRAVGVPCGILDQAASVLGRADAAVLLDCGTLEHRLVSVPPRAALAILDSGVERSLATTAYAERRAELELAMGAIGATRSTTITPEELDALEGVALRRLRHVVTENARVRRFAEALDHGELAAAGSLLRESHASLRDDYEVSVDELDLLVELAVSAGAYGARLLGGGFGGSVVALVEQDIAREVADGVIAAYRARTGRQGRAVIAVASDGAAVRELSKRP
jgi:galactokinase